MLFPTIVLCAFLAGASAFVLPPIPQGGRIVGGVEAKIEDFPFSVSLQYRFLGVYSHDCGGSILNSNHVLTAAHCTPDHVRTMRARVGSVTAKKGGQVAEVANYIPHPKWNPKANDYDVAILKLKTHFDFGPKIVPVVFATEADPEANAIVTVSGWGRTKESSPFSTSNVLLKVDLPVWNNDKCKEVYSFLTPRHICLGGLPEGGKSACMGDSGGPVIYKGKQVALVTGGDSCSEPNIPGIYTRISSILPWIKEVAQLK